MTEFVRERERDREKTAGYTILKLGATKVDIVSFVVGIRQRLSI
jgi:hypothetical protein